MSYMGPETTCLVCGHNYRPIFADGKAVSNGCPKCAESAEEKREREYFAKLDALPMEERIRRIEKWMFDKQYNRRSSAFTKY